MNKYLLILGVTLLVSGYTYATETDTSGMSNTSAVSQAAPMTDHVTMRDGKMILTKDGFMSLMKSDMTMSNGTVVKIDGTYRLKDGTYSWLKDGEQMDMDGKITKPK